MDLDTVIDNLIDAVLDEIAQLSHHDPQKTPFELYTEPLGLKADKENAARVLGDHLYYGMSLEELVTWLDQEGFDHDALLPYLASQDFAEPRQPSEDSVQDALWNMARCTLM